MSRRARRIPPIIQPQNEENTLSDLSQDTKYTIVNGNCVIHEGVVIVSERVFGNNKDIRSVTFPASLQYVGQGTFMQSSVTEISFQNPVIIAPSAFSKCTNLHTVKFFRGNAHHSRASRHKYHKTKLQKGAFFRCKKLKMVQLPPDYEIEDSVFADCWVLQSISLPTDITELGQNTFKGCRALEYVQFPQSLNTIGEGCFKNCQRLKKIVLPDTMNYIRSEAFLGCRDLFFVRLPKNIKEIRDKAFYGCTGLNTLDLPVKIENIEQEAFGGCERLSVVCPKFQQFQQSPVIDATAFQGCHVVLDASGGQLARTNETNFNKLFYNNTRMEIEYTVWNGGEQKFRMKGKTATMNTIESVHLRAVTNMRVTIYKAFQEYVYYRRALQRNQNQSRYIQSPIQWVARLYATWRDIKRLLPTQQSALLPLFILVATQYRRFRVLGKTPFDEIFTDLGFPPRRIQPSSSSQPSSQSSKKQKTALQLRF